MLAFGVYPEITLANARAHRDEARKLLANGVDPGEEIKMRRLNIVKQEPSKRWRSSGMAPIKSDLKYSICF